MSLGPRRRLGKGQLWICLIPEATPLRPEGARELGLRGAGGAPGPAELTGLDQTPPPPAQPYPIPRLSPQRHGVCDRSWVIQNGLPPSRGRR